MYAARALKRTSVGLGLVLILVAGGLVAAVGWRSSHRAVAPAPVLRALGPRTVSNQTASPLALYGEHFRAGMTLTLGAPVNLRVTPAVADATHAYVRLPPDLPLPATTSQVAVPLSIAGSKAAPVSLTLVNDSAFPDLTALAVSASGRVLAISQTTDQLFSVDPSKGAVVQVRTGDGPSALATYVDEAGRSRVVVAHRFTPELWDFPAELSSPPRKVAAPTNVSALLIRDGVAYLAEQASDSVVALTLASGGVRWRAKVAPNPGPLALAGASLAVGSQGAGVVQAVELATGAVQTAIQPTRDTEIIGGRTQDYARYVIGGKAVRGLAWSASLRRLFATSIGPNVGPNPDRMEVTMNPGVGVIDLAGGRFERHLGFNEGLDEGLALDDASGLLYAADIGLGVVRVIDSRRLASIKDAGTALLQEVPLPPPADFPRARPAKDFTAQSAGQEVHSGPVAVALAPDARTIYVLNRFSGTLAIVDVTAARAGQAKLLKQVPLVDPLTQRTRRLGQVLFYGDLARTGLTCDGCHTEGGAEGLFFAKTHPLRIYRAPTLRGAKDTPPYFTPASTHSLAQTSRVVGNRNRLFHLRLGAAEINALTTFTSEVTLLPNPNLGADGAPAAHLPLPWGGTGEPEEGEAVFTRLGCEHCHAPPLFTLDQDGATRGTYLDVGTPHALPIHPEWQEETNAAFGVPSLLGSWDVFPMLTSGAAGFDVDQGAARLSPRPPLRTVLEDEPAPHATQALTQAERDDLYAYLLSL